MAESLEVTPRFAAKMLEKVLRLYTPSMGEKAMAEFLADKCDDLGFDEIQIDEVGNLIARRDPAPPGCSCAGTWIPFPARSG